MATKKTVKKVASKKAPACPPREDCYCKGILALLIIILAWWNPAATWSQVVTTIAAAIILLSGNSCYCKK